MVGGFQFAKNAEALMNGTTAHPSAQPLTLGINALYGNTNYMTDFPLKNWFFCVFSSLPPPPHLYTIGENVYTFGEKRSSNSHNLCIKDTAFHWLKS